MRDFETRVGDLSIFNLRESIWNLSGAFSCDYGLHRFIDILHELSDGKSQVKSVFGCPSNLIWNGGRYSTDPSGDDIEKVISGYNRRGISVSVTANTIDIDEKDINDNAANNLLRSLIEVGSKYKINNGVILSSDKLLEHIHKNYNKLKTTASIIKSCSIEDRSDYYKEQMLKFDKVVLHPDDNFDMSLIGSLNTSKLEICVNEHCIYECSNRRNHYDLINKFNRKLISLKEMDELVNPLCLKGSQIFIEKTRRPCSYARSELKAVYNLGVRHFKIQGRRDLKYTFLPQLHDMCKYILNDRFYSDIVFKRIVVGGLNET